MKYLFIAEKPSLMRAVQSCYNKHKSEIQKKVGIIDFIALSGHVCQNAPPEVYDGMSGKWEEITYPMIPQNWIVKAADDERKKNILVKIQSLAPKYDGFIVGTDSDVEGYGIYYLLETYLHLEQKPALRFIEHSLTDKEILKWLLQMTDYHKDPVHRRFVQSFLLRNRADWLFGMNCTQMMTVKTGNLMTVGRVKAPTIKLVYDNSMAIDNFKPEQYYQCVADYGAFQGVQIDEKLSPLKFKRQTNERIPLEGTIELVEKQQTKTHAPQLYDLAIFQGEAGQTLGMTPAEVLETIQSLYEVHQVISYPRTQCRYVSSEKSLEFDEMLQQAKVFPNLAPYVEQITFADIQRVRSDKKVVNDVEVNKESHDALLPTSKTPVLNELNEREKVVCEMIYKRLLAQFLPQMEETKTRVVINHDTTKFLATGKLVTNQGWRALYREVKGSELPILEEGAKITAKEIGMVEKMTTPPKRLSQATLILTMKNIANQIEDKELRKSLAGSQGIGTAATRASIITDIIKRGYVEDRGRSGLYITPLGKAYVEQLNGIEIISPVFTAQLETKIKQIQRGEESYSLAYESMLKNLSHVCEQMEHVESVQFCEIACPRCQAQMKTTAYAYDCPSCGLKINKLIAGTVISKKNIEEFRKNKQTKTMKFTSKEKKSFYAKLKLEGDGVVFDFSSGIHCPKCGREMIMNNGGCFCDCGLKVYRKVGNKILTDKQLETLITKGSVNKINGFKTKDGKLFSAGLKINGSKVEFVF